MKHLLSLLVFIFPLAVFAEPPKTPTKSPTIATDDEDWPEDDNKIDAEVKTIKDDKAVAANNTMPPPERDEARRDLPKRLDKIEEIAGRHAQNPVAQEKVTEAYMDVGEPQRAAPHADQFVELARKKNDPETLDKALDLRAGVNMTLHNYPAVVADAKEVLSRKPGDETARRLLALSQSRGGGDVNLSKIKKPEDLAPQDGARPKAGAAERETAARTPAARPAETQVLADARRTAELRAQVSAHDDAQRYLSLGDFPAAIKSIDVSLAKHPGNAQLLTLRAQAELGAGQPDGALKDAEAAVLAGPKMPEARAARAKAKEALKAPVPEILADYQAAKELDPRFTADYEQALARLGGSGGALVDANGIGTAGRKGLAFNPASAREQLFGALPEPLRSLAPVLIIALVAGIVAGATWWLKRYGGSA